MTDDHAEGRRPILFTTGNVHQMTDEDDSSLLADLSPRIQGKLPPYTGKDLNIANCWYCKTCYADPSDDASVEMMTCEDCGIVRYCSAQCQEKDFSEHKETCVCIRDQSRIVEQEKLELRARTDAESHPNTRPTDNYRHGLHQLANHLSNLAQKYEVKPLLEMVLSHRLECLRLDARDELRLRYEVPFDLLDVHRDADCYVFVEHWIEHDGDDLSDMHANTVEGEWFYPQGNTCRLDDIFEGRVEKWDCPLPFLVALLLMKLRILAQYEALVRQVWEFADTTFGESLGEDPLEHILHHVMTTPDGIHLTDDVIEQQVAHVERYIHMINRKKSAVLKAILFPGPLLKSTTLFELSDRPALAEVYRLVQRCARTFARVPGAQDRMFLVMGEHVGYCTDEYLHD